MVRESLSMFVRARLGASAIAAVILAGCATTPPPVPAALPPPATAAPPPAAAPAGDAPPPAPREFRAAWIATVSNIDWPSRRDMGVAEQKAEIIRIVERARELRLNALIFQVRPAADAFYASALEPWSEFLTGEQGRAPVPFYDPLQTWIAEAHKRGIALHAWFNPYRARHTSAKGPNAPSHIANANPEVVRRYGGALWMDPGEPVAARRTLEVILDVVRRYDIDGVHIDDYFYPYPVNVPGSEPPVEQEFPDDPSWQRALAAGAAGSRADWRRDNVNRMIEEIDARIHREKPWVRFGISPFGIGRPDRRPSGIAGFSQYDKLYADVELWMSRGWLDYLVPQLYWPRNQKEQAFEPLLDYWLAQNVQRRHVWPGYFTSRIDHTEKSWPPEEILGQIALTRERNMEQGHVHFSMAALVENRKGIGELLRGAAYRDEALIPAAPWLAPADPFEPVLRVVADAAKREIRIVRPAAGAADPAVATVAAGAAQGAGAAQVAAWVRAGGAWRFALAPAGAAETPGGDGTVAVFPFDRFDATQSPDRAVAFAIDRYGREGPRATWSAGEAR